MSTSTARSTPRRVPPRPARRRTRHAVWRRARRRRRRLLWILLLSLAGLVLLAFFAAVAERIVYRQRVMPGVSVEGVHVAGVSEKDAYVRLSALAAKLETAPLRARAASRALVASPSIAGLEIDEDATLRAARKAGRSRNPFAQTSNTFLRRFRPERVPLHVDFNAEGVEGILDGWSRATLGGQVEGGLSFDGTTVTAIEPQAGIGIVRAPARRLLVQHLRGSDRSTLILPVGKVEPHVSSTEVQRAATQARNILQGDHVLVTDGATLTITPPQLALAMGSQVRGSRLEVTVDGTKLRAALLGGLAPLEQAPVDAHFEISSENIPGVVPSQNGRQVDMDAIGRAIVDGERQIIAALEDVVPAHDTAWAQALGIKEQVSTFTTKHNAGEARVTNIHLAADILNNTIVEPGAVFSLNDTLGRRTPERGFVKAPVIYSGEFTEDYGGGVSQLSTTTFNAVFFGGYEDVEHTPHTVYITRYPMGREATLNFGTIDLKFRNNTQHGVLIRTGYSATAITVTFYGDNDGRTVTEEGRRILVEKPVEDALINCPAAIEIDKKNDCATLPIGATKQVEAGHTGYDVELFRVIEQPGQAEVREKFFWHYTMMKNKVLVGTVPPTTTVAPTTIEGAPVPTTLGATGPSGAAPPAGTPTAPTPAP